MPKKILIVDDEPYIAKGLKFSLESDGYDVNTCGDGETALRMFREETYDMVLLDVMLPGISGTEVCQRIREFSDVPIIMITAKGEDMDKILGLEYGADDYMTKPFNILEVKARVKTIFRRSGQIIVEEVDEHRIHVKDMVIDTNTHIVTLKGSILRLTTK